MRYLGSSLFIMTLGAASLLGFSETAFAQYEITKFTLAPGGPRSGGVYTMNDASGQHDAGTLTDGATYTIYGGFYHPILATACCEGDGALPHDGSVSVADQAAVKRFIGGSSPEGLGGQGDAACPHDGSVSVADFAAVKRRLGGSCVVIP